MSTENTDPSNQAQNSWDIPGQEGASLRGLDEGAPLQQWPAIEAQLARKRRKRVLFWWLPALLLISTLGGVGLFYFAGNGSANEAVEIAANKPAITLSAVEIAAANKEKTFRAHNTSKAEAAVPQPKNNPDQANPDGQNEPRINNPNKPQQTQKYGASESTDKVTNQIPMPKENDEDARLLANSQATSKSPTKKERRINRKGNKDRQVIANLANTNVKQLRGTSTGVETQFSNESAAVKERDAVNAKTQTVATHTTQYSALAEAKSNTIVPSGSNTKGEINSPVTSEKAEIGLDEPIVTSALAPLIADTSSKKPAPILPPSIPKDSTAQMAKADTSKADAAVSKWHFAFGVAAVTLRGTGILASPGEGQIAKLNSYTAPTGLQAVLGTSYAITSRLSAEANIAARYTQGQISVDFYDPASANSYTQNPDGSYTGTPKASRKSKSLNTLEGQFQLALAYQLSRRWAVAAGANAHGLGLDQVSFAATVRRSIGKGFALEASTLLGLPRSVQPIPYLDQNRNRSLIILGLRKVW